MCVLLYSFILPSPTIYTHLYVSVFCSPTESRGGDDNELMDIPTKANEFDEEELKLKQQTDTVMRYASIVLLREYDGRYNGVAHCELDVIKEELRNLVKTTLLRVPVDVRDRNVAQVRDSALASMGSMDELMELVRVVVVPGEKKKYTFKSEETRQSLVANAARMTQAKHDALRDGNSSIESLHAMCRNSLVSIPDSGGLCNKDVVLFRHGGRGIVVTEKRLLRHVGKTMAISAGFEITVLREYEFILMTEVTEGKKTKLKTYEGSTLSLPGETKLYFVHENFNKDTTPTELASMTRDSSIRARTREASTFVFRQAGCNLKADSNGKRPCREEKCNAHGVSGNFDCCKNCGKEFKKRYTNEAGWEAAREADGLPITVEVSCPNKNKGCKWTCMSNQTRMYAAHKRDCNRKFT